MPPRGAYGPNYTAEYRARAVNVALQAIVFGWSIARVAKLSGIKRVTLLSWLSSDEYFDRYKRAMEAKALDIPSWHLDIVKRVIDGKIEPAVAGVALRSLEFRMMREIKRIYTPQLDVHAKRQIDDLTDREVVARFEELERKAIEARQQQIEGTARDVTEDEPDA